MNTVFIVESFFTVEELSALRSECDTIFRKNKWRDLSALGSSIDLFEDSNISEADPIRTNRLNYFNERWKTGRPSYSNIIEELLIRRLPCLLKQILIEYQQKADSFFLFNEHYIVKESGQNSTAFRWHRDCDEQLGALQSGVEYYSIWCPLDDVNETNGTLIVPRDTEIIRLSKSPQKFCDDSSATRSTGIDDENSLPPVSITTTAGSAVLFSSKLWHSSDYNRSDTTRRVYYAQYSRDIISGPSSGPGDPLAFAISCSIADTDLATRSCST